MILLTPRLLRGLAGAAIVVAGLAGCGGDPQASYCRVVEANQAELGAIVGSGERDALLEALPVLERLSAAAPDDISDEWRSVIRALSALDRAFDDAGVDPATYDPEDPPAGLDDTHRARLERAATELANARTVRALSDLEQHALDVCKTPIGL